MDERVSRVFEAKKSTTLRRWRDGAPPARKTHENAGLGRQSMIESASWYLS